MKPWIPLLLFLVFTFLTVTSSGAVVRNLQLRQINQAWASLDLTDVPGSDALQDGIPDGWEAQFWGGAKRIYRIDSENALAGNHAVVLKRTNAQGVVALAQRVAVVPGSHLVAIVYARGEKGAIQFRFRAKDSDSWAAKGWLEMEPGDEWQEFRLSVLAPADATQAELLLRTGNQIWFDETYLGIDRNGQPGPNLLQNPGLEDDGLSENPLDWWQEHVVSGGPLSMSNHTVVDRLSVLNIVDMLNERHELIQQRARQIGSSCAAFPDMTSWLLAWGPEFEEMGGAAARERLYPLAIQLAPNCPQPYAALAKLYESHNAHWKAADLYRQAAELAGEVTEAGKYHFEEGYLRIRHTGETARAATALQKAEEIRGWERGVSYQGAASFYLGQALETEGQVSQAAAAYRRVLNCNHCHYYHNLAQDRLTALSTER